MQSEKIVNKREKGKLGEGLAAEFLSAEGFKVLERGFLCRRGEVDIIASKNKELYFIEVKTRWSNAFGGPLEAVDLRKQKRFIMAVRFYMLKKRLADVNCHLSVIGVDMSGGEPEIEFIENAFEAN